MGPSPFQNANSFSLPHELRPFRPHVFCRNVPPCSRGMEGTVRQACREINIFITEFLEMFQVVGRAFHLKEILHKLPTPIDEGRNLELAVRVFVR
jgi:hypothetical protein